MTEGLQQLLDREAIRDCIYRYCRGVDRAELEALRDSYWPDAHDSHGAYKGPASGFIEMAQAVFRSGARNVHQVSNILIEFTGEGQAVVESYFNALQRGPDREGVVRQYLLCGRYCDRFEKRGAEWRVADRTVVYDWVEEQTPPAENEAARFGPRQPIGTAFPHDPIYGLLGVTGNGTTR